MSMKDQGIVTSLQMDSYSDAVPKHFWYFQKSYFGYFVLFYIKYIILTIETYLPVTKSTVSLYNCPASKSPCLWF